MTRRSLLHRLAARREARILAALITLLAAFWGLLVLVRGEWLPGLDLRLTRALQSERSRPSDIFAVTLTYLGGGIPLVLQGIVASLWVLRHKRPRTAGLLFLSSLVGHPVDFLIKMIANRPRPGMDQVDVILHASGTSFPSGHALATLLFYGFCAVLLLVLPNRRMLRHLASAALVIVAVFVGLSRVYVGGHWASDVLGGWVCGLFFLACLVEVHRLVAARELAPPPTGSPQRGAGDADTAGTADAASGDPPVLSGR